MRSRGVHDLPAVTSDQRRVLETIADLLIPEGAGMPRASAAGVAGEGLDRVLQSSPELWPGLRDALASIAGLSVDQMRAGLRQPDRAGTFSIISEAVIGAYFLDPAILRRLGYPGRQSVPIQHPSLDADDEELLRPVIARGAIFRAC